MLTAEDTRKSILVPRLIAAGADCDRVYIFGWVREDEKKRMFLLAEDLARLEEAMGEIGDVGLVTIDPMTAYMGGKVEVTARPMFEISLAR
jgi:putative DNA primase/helicase